MGLHLQYSCLAILAASCGIYLAVAYPVVDQGKLLFYFLIFRNKKSIHVKLNMFPYIISINKVV